MTSAFGAPSGAEIRAQASVLLNTQAPVETREIVHRLDASAPTSTVTASQVTPGGGDYLVSWQAEDGDVPIVTATISAVIQHRTQSTSLAAWP